MPLYWGHWLGRFFVRFEHPNYILSIIFLPDEQPISHFGLRCPAAVRSRRSRHDPLPVEATTTRDLLPGSSSAWLPPDFPDYDSTTAVFSTPRSIQG
jgi:hypothetical protein